MTGSSRRQARKSYAVDRKQRTAGPGEIDMRLTGSGGWQARETDRMEKKGNM